MRASRTRIIYLSDNGCSVPQELTVAGKVTLSDAYGVLAEHFTKHDNDEWSADDVQMHYNVVVFHIP